jgi:hypothetical protein
MRRLVETAWWMLLVGAIAALAIAAFATAADDGGISRFAGSVAWVLALAGSVGALVVGVGRRTR